VSLLWPCDKKVCGEGPDGTRLAATRDAAGGAAAEVEDAMEQDSGAVQTGMTPLQRGFPELREPV
jgi:hypothetical protein